MGQTASEANPEPFHFEPLLDTQQAARLLHVHPETLKRRARRGEIPGLKFGKVWRFRASVLDAYVRKRMA